MENTLRNYTPVRDSARYARTIQTRFVARTAGGVLLVAAIYVGFSRNVAVLTKGLAALLAFGALALAWRSRDRRFPCYRCRRAMTERTGKFLSDTSQLFLVCDSCKCYVVVAETGPSD